MATVNDAHDDPGEIPVLTDGTIYGAVLLWCFNNEQALMIYGPIEDWNVSSVTNMSRLFENRHTFNSDISRWNVSQVNDMSHMFEGAAVFNQPLNNWDVSHVTNMHRMFASAKAFNQPLDRWTVTHVTNMSGMFENATIFNQPLHGWDVSAVRDISDMFTFAFAPSVPNGVRNESIITIIGQRLQWEQVNIAEPLSTLLSFVYDRLPPDILNEIREMLWSPLTNNAIIRR